MESVELMQGSCRSIPDAEGEACTFIPPRLFEEETESGRCGGDVTCWGPGFSFFPPAGDIGSRNAGRQERCERKANSATAKNRVFTR